jgi:hypothetical protein
MSEIGETLEIKCATYLRVRDIMFSPAARIF